MNIRHKFLNPSKKAMKELTTEFGETKLKAILSVLAKRDQASWWINLHTHRSLTTVVTELMDLEPSFVFEISFAELE